MDGTFKSAPVDFMQLYILHAEFNSQCFPIIYCFLNRKTVETYTSMFARIRSTLLQHSIIFNPHTIQIDYEYAAYNAIRAEFPATTIKGCFFHFGQAIWRKLVDIGLKTFFNQDSNFRESVQMITSLALIPLDDIDEGWEIVKSSFLNPTWQVNQFLAYVEDVWLSRRRSLFGREIWSQCGVLRGRTNNYAEGVHSAINASINRAHPNFYELLHILFRMQTLHSLEYLRLIDGGGNKPRKRNYIQQDLRIEEAYELFGRRLIDLRQLLKALSRAIKLNI